LHVITTPEIAKRETSKGGTQEAGQRICGIVSIGAVKILGKFSKGHFSISATGKARGKSLELLTREILKGSKPSD